MNMSTSFSYIRRATLLAALIAGAFTLGGCNDAQAGGLLGAGGGALLGQAIGRDTTSTLIGAGAGALTGYIIGNEMDKDRYQRGGRYREYRRDCPDYGYYEYREYRHSCRDYDY
jgi:uncharacterized protein YcfJ